MSTGKKGHVHHGKSTKDILDAGKVVTAAGLKQGEVFLDAGSGDGFISFAASSVVGEEGKVYALDVYLDSISHVKREVKERGTKNLEPLLADLTVKIPLGDNSIDRCLMANVLHGFVENEELDEVMKEISRVIKPEGVLTVVEFKKEKIPGPPMEIRLTPEDVSELLDPYNFEAVQTEGVGYFHYLVMMVNKK